MSASNLAGKVSDHPEAMEGGAVDADAASGCGVAGAEVLVALSAGKTARAV